MVSKLLLQTYKSASTLVTSMFQILAIDDIDFQIFIIPLTCIIFMHYN